MAIQINLAKSAGFCFGVKRALHIAFEVAKSGGEIQMLGDIVHNEDVVKEISKTGIKKITRLEDGCNKTLLIRAHGAPEKITQKAKELNYSIVDATCPMVKEIHKIAKEMEQKDNKIIVIGDRRHDEVKGIVGQLKQKALVIDSAKNINLADIRKISKASVVVQSTQTTENVNKIVNILKQNIQELNIFDTICKPTKTKQEEIKTMPLENDVMVIIGSRTSANTKRLYQISKSLNKNTFWIQSEKQIKPKWFKNVKNVGISAGASTPDSTTSEVIECISQISQD